MTHPPQPARSTESRVLVLLLTLTVAYCAVAMNLSWIHAWHNSDTLLLSLISLDRYTPFYWDENRYGMLSPLLAMPVRDYAWNMLLQTQLTIVSGFAFVFLLQRLSGTHDVARLAITVPLTATVLATLFQFGAIYPILLASPYLPSIGLLAASLYVLKGHARLKWPIAAVLLSLGLWVNVSNAAMALVTVLLQPVEKPRERWLPVAMVVGCSAGILFFASTYPGNYHQVLPPSAWIPGAFRLLTNIRNSLQSLPALAVFGFAAVGLARRKRPLWRETDALAAGAAVQIFATATSDWVAKNGFDARYVIGPVFVLLTIALQVALDAMLPREAKIPRIAGAGFASAVALGMSLIIFGVPSVARAQSAFYSSTARLSSEIGRLACTHMVGDYWYVWTSVYHNRLKGAEPKLWGLTYRAEETRRFWNKIPVEQRRYCSVCSDPMREFMRKIMYLEPLVQTGSAGELCLFAERK